MSAPPPGESQPRRPHHLSSVADAFLSAPAPSEKPRRSVVVAGPGVGAVDPIASALAGIGEGGGLHDLGDTVGVRLPRWEREGLQCVAGMGGTRVLVWCVRGADGLSLVSALILGRLAALLEPTATTVVWSPDEGSVASGIPEKRFQDQVRRLILTAVPRARVGLHCLGWSQDLAADLRALAARFA